MECLAQSQSATAAPHHPSLWDKMGTTSWCSEWNSKHSLLSQDNDAEAVVDKNDLNTQK
ncbi:hypothetical protein DPMN_168592, partial [Dreissena polymorpha]